MRFWVGLIAGIVATLAVAIVLMLTGVLRSPLVTSDQYLDCAGTQSTRNLTNPTEDQSRTLLRMRPATDGQQPSLEVVQALAGGPLGLAYVVQLCADSECQSEITEAKISAKKGEPGGDYFHHFEISRITGQYTASQRVGYELLVEETGTCSVVTRPQF